ncbi:MAG TPA: prephenate dehydrogenase [Deltaproteobacteria bacterium]|nr:prephenate dehydrogenase [Deltaproteobacteria bacterium]
MNIAIIGLGLIGASLAKALQGTARITGIDKNPETIRQALSEGVIVTGGDDPALCTRSDMVIVSVPVRSIVDAARAVIPHLRPGTIITDTGSTKARIVHEMASLWPDFLGSHPIAGRERSGYAASDAGLFSGAVVILTPGSSCETGIGERVTWLWKTCGAFTREMNPEEHDELMARISHMPHLLSFASMCLAEDLALHKQILGAGFRDFTRIAASDHLMWRDILLDNREHLLGLIDRYTEELTRIRSLMELGSEGALADTLARYAQIRSTLQ